MVAVKRHRRRRRGKKHFVNAAEILSKIAREELSDIISSPESSPLELDGDFLSDLSQLPPTVSTTPGSLDSSLSVWELGEDDIDSTLKPQIHSFDTVLQPHIHAFSIDDASHGKAQTNRINELTQGIESVLADLKKTTHDFSRTCVSSRLCVPRLEATTQSTPFASILQTIQESYEYVSDKLIDVQFALPTSVGSVLATLSTKPVVPTQSTEIPILNRKQRRIVHGITKS